MKNIILLVCFTFQLISSVKSQVKIIHVFDKHERGKSTQFADSTTINRKFDNVGNIISEEIISPCGDRPTPIITHNRPLTFCPGDSTILTAPLSLSYLWVNGDTTRSIIVKQTGIYTVTVLTATNCSKISLPDTITVNINGVNTPLTDSYIFGAKTDTIFNTASNWYVYSANTNGYSIATSAPLNSSNIIIPSIGSCVHALPALTVSTTVQDLKILLGAKLSLNSNSLTHLRHVCLIMHSV